eukprot:TRINITY_DN2204_c0_g2_i2.p1 TRINITY_DN2204_c0_g2~~TRINITY_DN2204_c0_g2_i2.p1  ORF type:complete len:234 (-),score=35.37 TRINITY_DN2204_c0_g2_i2:170-871(-)
MFTRRAFITGGSMGTPKIWSGMTLSRPFATKMQAGSTKKTKDSAGRRLGIKKFGTEEVFPDEIVLRQRGFQWHPGRNTYFGKDHTIHSKIEGRVSFERDPWRKRKKFYVHIDPAENVNRYVRPPPPYVYHPELFPDRAANNPQPAQFPMPKRPPVNPPRIKHNGTMLSQSPFSKIVDVPEEYLAREIVELHLRPSNDEDITVYIKELESKYIRKDVNVDAELESATGNKKASA